MANKAKDVTFRLRLLEWKQFAEGAAAGGKAVKALGTDAEIAGKKAASSSRGWGIYSKHTDTARRHTDKTRLSLHKLVGSLGAVGVGYGAVTGIKDSINTTKDLGEATLNLNKIQGLSLSAASQYAMVAQVRGIGQKGLAQGLNILARNTVNAEKQWGKSNQGRVASSKATNAKLLAAQQAYDRKVALLGNSAKDRVRAQLALTELQQKRAAILAGKKGPGALGTAADAFKRLGFTQDQVTKGSKNMGQFLLTISDRFNKLHGGVAKSQIGLQLFGRGAQKILPLFKEGDESLRTNLGWAKKYGVAMGGENPKQLRKFLVAQDKAHYATLGMQVALGQYLAPAVIKVMEAWPKMIDNIKKGHGIWGPIKTVVTGVAGALKLVVGLFSKSKLASDVLVGALTVLGAAWGIDKVIGFQKALRGTWLMTRVLGPQIENGLTNSVRAGRFAGAGRLLGRTLGIAAGAYVAYEIAKAVKDWVSKKFARLISDMYASNRDPVVRRGERMIHSPSAIGQIKIWDKLHPGLSKKLHATAGSGWSPSLLKQLIANGYPGLIPGGPGVPKNYKPKVLAVPKHRATTRSTGTDSPKGFTHTTHTTVVLDKKVLATAMAKEFVVLRALL